MNDKEPSRLEKKLIDKSQIYFDSQNLAYETGIHLDFDAIRELIKDTSSSYIFSGRKLNNIQGAEFMIKAAIPHLFNIKSALKGSNEIYLNLSKELIIKAQSFITTTLNHAQKALGNPSISNANSKLLAKLEEAWKVTHLIGSLDMGDDFQEVYNNDKKNLEELCTSYGVSTVSTIQRKIPQQSFVIHSSEVVNLDDKDVVLAVISPFYYKHLRNLKLVLNITSFRTETVDFFLKEVNSERNHIITSENIMEGFEITSTQTIDPGTQTITFRSSGDYRKRIYPVGRHFIEIWLKGINIYTAEFSIVLSPLQKIENKLSAEEIKLEEIIQTIFLSAEIEGAHNAIVNLNKFKFLRMPSEKQRQIERQKRKIEQFTVWAEIEKNKSIFEIQFSISNLKQQLLLAKYDFVSNNSSF